MAVIEVDSSDLFKIHDALAHAVRHHEARDEMNAALHLATNTRASPLTSEIAAAEERLRQIIEEADHGA